MTERGGRRTARNIAALYGVQIATYLLPLLTVPFLARTLGPQAWGALAVAQAFGGMVGLLIDYGFDLSATREVARVQSDPARRAELLSGVLGARLLMTLIAAALTLLAQAAVPALNHPLLLWAAVAWGAAQASNLMWYFQGVERVTRVAGLDVAAKVAVTAGILLLIRRPSDAWLVPALTAGAALLSNAWALRLAHRDTPFLWPSWSRALRTLRLGWSMFLFRGSAAFYSTASAFLLGLFVPVGLVGHYAGAERIARAVQGLLTPLNRALYPRFARAAGEGPAATRALLPAGLRLMGGAGAVLSAGTWLAAPLLVGVLLGPGFEPAVPVLRVLAALPLVIGVNMVFGLFWLVPLGHDRAFNLTVALGALLNAALIALLVPASGPLGMAWAVVLTEVLVGGGLYLLYRQTRRPAPARGRPAEV
ncbi:oligosaccharide flippase family protein (plasmid) [Deinococcus taeanensis]|uniref:oligosaccharide flippase family protein n=1 Tax=Deinococcus taeanensis TaxID=2737050 RepID=UPI001CDB6A8B|nr:oligosaccharide flippase family protein [Deinococcus taeanensis]UBV44315.1 oligosaccharide flippase family protein [Deinococcus taeanensis]